MIRLTDDNKTQNVKITGSSYCFIIPKYLVRSKIISLDKQYIVYIEEVPEKDSL